MLATFYGAARNGKELLVDPPTVSEPSIFSPKLGISGADESCSVLSAPNGHSLDTADAFSGEAIGMGVKLGILASFGGVSVCGFDFDVSLADPKLGFDPANNSEAFEISELFPKGVPDLKPELGVSPAASNPGIPTSISISDSLASIFWSSGGSSVSEPLIAM